jgi:FixJ family two-component response regulator
MTTPRELRRTTADPRTLKRARVLDAIVNPDNRELSNRHLARLLEVDESMVRRYRAEMTRVAKRKKKP